MTKYYCKECKKELNIAPLNYYLCNNSKCKMFYHLIKPSLLQYRQHRLQKAQTQFRNSLNNQIKLF